MQLNKNITRVCSKYGYTTKRPVRGHFLHSDNMVYCFIEKVSIKMIKSHLLIDSLLQAASTTWIAEFFRLESNRFNGDRQQISKLVIGEELFESIVSDPTNPVVLFSTVRHPIER